MVSLQGVGAAVVGVAIVLGCAAAVYRDANRVGIARPLLWAAVVVVTSGLALGLYFGGPDVPIPGLLVIVLAGPLFYLFERDDAKHGDEPADPYVLSDDSDGGERTSDRRPDE